MWFQRPPLEFIVLTWLLLVGQVGTYTDLSRENLAVIPDDDENGDHGDERDVKYFDTIISDFMRERAIPGASVAISKNGEFLFRRGYGQAGSFRIVTPWSLFRIGSVSKPVTAMGVLKLHERGQLCIDCKVFGPAGILRQYPLPERSDPRLLLITVRQLLQHKGGWDQRLTGDPLLWRGIGKLMGASDPPDKHTLLRYVLSQPLQYQPGSRYAYSNLGYMVLGRVIEKVSGRGYQSFICDLLIHIGIYNMKLGHTRRKENDIYEVEYFSGGHRSKVESVFPGDGMVPPAYGGFYLENMDSTSGWIASATDLVRFFDALDSSGAWRLLRADTFHEMVAAPSKPDMTSWYGLGVVVQDGGHTWWHSGLLDGSTAILTHDRSGFTWAVLLNSRLEYNDLDDLMKFAIRRVPYWFGLIPLPAPPLEDSILSQNGRHLVKVMIPEQKYPYVFQRIVSQGFRLTWLDAFSGADRTVMFNSIWVKDDTKKWKAYKGLTSSAYRRRYRSKVAQGYRLLQLDSYVSDKRLRYSAIFVKEPWPSWASYHGYSPQEHRQRFYTLYKEGYRLVSQAITEFKGKLYISAIYDLLELGEFRVRMGLGVTQFGQESQKQVSAGRILSYVKAYTHNGATRFSAVWGTRTSSQWASRYGITKYGLMNQLYDYADMNLPLVCVAGYEEDGVETFAALWR